MAINKKLIHFENFENFNSKKLSANKENTKYTVGISGEVINGTDIDILYQSIVYIKDTQQQWTHGTLYSTVNWDILDDYFDLNHGVGIIINYNYTVPQNSFFSLNDLYSNYLYLHGDQASYEKYVKWIKSLKGDTVVLNLLTYDYPKVIEIIDVSGEILYTGKVSIGYSQYEVRLPISVFSKKGIRINISNVE